MCKYFWVAVSCIQVSVNYKQQLLEFFHTNEPFNFHAIIIVNGFYTQIGTVQKSRKTEPKLNRTNCFTVFLLFRWPVTALLEMMLASATKITPIYIFALKFEYFPIALYRALLRKEINIVLKWP